jgi:membrane associated rhomboid family serine protease
VSSSGGADLFVVCKKCGSEVSPYVTECPYCGTRLRKRAPKLDRPDKPPKPSRRHARPSLGRLKPGEIPGIAPDRRPYATIALVLGSIALTLVTLADLVPYADVIVFGEPGDEWWRVLTASFAYDNAGYQFAALLAIGLFGYLLERRHGPIPVVLIFLCCGSAGMLVAATVQPDVIAAGGNAAALGLLAAWSVPDLLALRRHEEIEGDLLGVAVIAALLLAMPLAVEEADPLAGVTGGLLGLILGLPLSRLLRES